jgi:hypothetical protein
MEQVGEKGPKTGTDRKKTTIHKTNLGNLIGSSLHLVFARKMNVVESDYASL